MPADKAKRSRRPTIDSDGRLHATVTDAALANGISPCAAWTRARFRKKGWAFLDEIEAPPQAPQAPQAPSGGQPVP
jgi:hypothetical protein